MGEINEQVDDYYDLGSFHREVTTSSSNAQIWFDRGLTWSYAFNHEEAVECFEKALTYDRNCAMAYWGLAYSLGPNYNKPWDYFDEEDFGNAVIRAHRAAVQAKEITSFKTPAESALVDALQARYPEDRSAKNYPLWSKAYADAMELVYAEFPDDLDVATLYADAQMGLTPWQLWDLHSGKPTKGSRALDAKRVLDRALLQDDGVAHPGLLHLYIHLMEMSSTPEAALTVADHLRGLVPDAGHLEHMPTHIDVLCGDYRRTIASNSAAIRADEKLVARGGRRLNTYTLYRAHNYHFRIYGAMFAGQSRVAIDTAIQLEAAISDNLLRIKSPPMADWLEAFLTSRVHVLIRFGRWQDILDLRLPHDQELYCCSTAMLHYAKGVAFAATGNVDEADRERVLFNLAVQRVAPTRSLFNNKFINILAIASAMLDGEVEYRRKNYINAFQSLRKAIVLYDSLPYDEPWGWMQPTRHAYGALLLEQGHVEEAAAVYSADLGMDDTIPRALRHLNNVWSLHGYHECLIKLGRTAEAQIVKPQLALAVAGADVPIRSSCFCRIER